MTDGQQDPVMEAYEREESIRIWKENARRRKEAGVTLSEELLIEQRENAELVVYEPEYYSTESQPVSLPASTTISPPDPESALRRSAIAISFVLALILLYVWIKGRR